MAPTLQAPPPKSPVVEHDLFDRSETRKPSLCAPYLLREALKHSIVMLRPDIQWKNPVMFVVEVGTVLSILFTIQAIWVPGQASLSYLVALDVWLALTVLFANFATALAEARGKAQADSLRKTRREKPAWIQRSDGTLQQKN